MGYSNNYKTYKGRKNDQFKPVNSDTHISGEEKIHETRDRILATT